MYVCMYVCIDACPTVNICKQEISPRAPHVRCAYAERTRLPAHRSNGEENECVRITIKPGLSVRTKFRIIARFGSSVVFGGKLMVASRLKFRRWSAGESRD